MNLLDKHGFSKMPKAITLVSKFIIMSINGRGLKHDRHQKNELSRLGE
jgi:hypothetical protein